MSIYSIYSSVQRHSISTKMMEPSKSFVRYSLNDSIFIVLIDYSQLHHILIATAICAQWRFVGASSTWCIAAVHVIVTKEFKCWHIHCQVFVDVPGTGYRAGWPLFIAAQQFRYRTKRLVSHNTRRCGRYTKINAIHELLGILQCRRTSCTSADQTATTLFHVSRIHCTDFRTSLTSGRKWRK